MTETKYNLDLLNFPFIKRLLFWKAFPYLFQTVILFILLSLIGLGWGVKTSSNFVCLLIWAVWWPLMIWTVVLIGRVWCMVCPLELVSRFGGRIAHLLKMKNHPANKTIKSGTIIVCLYVFVQLLESGTDLHNVPAYTSIFLTGLIVFSFSIGLIFGNGTFCRGFCPIAMTLNAYSRWSMLAVRTVSENKCAGCKDKGCIKSNGSKKIFQTRGCPANIYPPQLKSNQDCLLCGQCIKSCNSGNVHLFFRLPFSKIDQREKRASWPLTLFIMADSGFVLRELCEQWTSSDSIFMAVPQFFLDYFRLQAYSGWVEGVWALLIFPLLLWTLIGGALKAAGAVKSIAYLWRDSAFIAVIIFSFLHMSLGLILIFRLASVFHK